MRKYLFGELTQNDAHKVELFYLGLDLNERRRRFGAAISDSAIARYCRSIDWRHSIVLARQRAYLLDTVLEIHPLNESWAKAELALASALSFGRAGVFSQLTYLALLTAGKRGCKTFVFLRDESFQEILPMLREIGYIENGIEFATLDLGHYSISSESSLTASGFTASESSPPNPNKPPRIGPDRESFSDSAKWTKQSPPPLISSS